MPRKIVITEEQLREIVSQSVQQDVPARICDYVRGFGVKGKLPSFTGKISDYYTPVLKKAYEWACQSTDGVARDGLPYFVHDFKVNVVGNFMFNKRGLIYVERSIDIDVSAGLDNLGFKSIGECWSWKRLNSQSYCAGFSMTNNNIVQVIICGYVHPDSVDWLETVYLNSYNMRNETEIRMNDNAKVEVAYIKIGGDKYPMGGSYLIDASSDKYKPNRVSW